MKIDKTKVFVLLVTLNLLSACSPGMKMYENNYIRDALNSQQKNKLDVILITPELLANINTNHVKKPTYLVGEQDVLSIRVWGGVDLNTNVQTSYTQTDVFVVQNDGTIFYPYIGNIVVANKSIEQIRLLLTKGLSKYVNNPQISIDISEYYSKRVHVMGEVKNPGIYPITSTPMSILDAILLGGINNATVNAERIFVIRQKKADPSQIYKPEIYRFNGESADTLLLAGMFYLQDSDVVFLAPAGVILWNRVISNILPSIGLGAQINSINN